MTDDERGRACTLCGYGITNDAHCTCAECGRPLYARPIAAMREGDVNTKGDYLREASGVKGKLDEPVTQRGEDGYEHDRLKAQRAEMERRERGKTAAGFINACTDLCKALCNQLEKRAEVAEALAKAEREQRESAGVAYRKEIGELREHATDDYHRAKRWIGLVTTDSDEVIEEMQRERDEAVSECQRLRDESFEDSEAAVKMLKERDEAVKAKQEWVDAHLVVTNRCLSAEKERDEARAEVGRLRELLREAETCMWEHHNMKYHDYSAPMFRGGSCVVCDSHPRIFFRIADALGSGRTP